MREGGFPFLRTDLASRAIDNGLYGVGSKRAIAHLDWDWGGRFKANPNGQHFSLAQQRRQKIELSVMVRDSDIPLLLLMIDGLSYTVYDEPFYQQKELRRRVDSRSTAWTFPVLDFS
jgi:hypothetical protein